MLSLGMYGESTCRRVCPYGGLSVQSGGFRLQADRSRRVTPVQMIEAKVSDYLKRQTRIVVVVCLGESRMFLEERQMFATLK